MGESEAQFQQAVVDLAQLKGWLVTTADTGHLLMVNERTGGRVLVVAVLEDDLGLVTEEGVRWGRALMAGCGPNCYRIWRPSDLEEIAAELDR